MLFDPEKSRKYLMRSCAVLLMRAKVCLQLLEAKVGVRGVMFVGLRVNLLKEQK